MKNAIVLAAVLATSTARAEEECPGHSAHSVGVDERGDEGMGFSHLKTAHHFVLTRTGGLIVASANDDKDMKSRSAIVAHFRHIASAFRAGNFEMPMFIHDRVPPGVPTLKRLAGEIDYSVEETETGGRVVVASKNPEAIAAIHDFLKFQIEDHRTGDTTSVEP